MRKHFLLVPIALTFSAASMMAQAPRPAAAKPAAPRPAAAQATAKPVGTIKELMDYIVIPTSQFLFGVVGSEEGPNGVVEKAPKSNAEWAEVRKNVVLLSEAGNLLMIPGRRVAGPNDKSNNPGTELEPAQMDALIAKDRAGFAKKAQGLAEAVAAAMKAVDAKSAEQLSDADGEIDEACESCHTTFWYPDQVIPDIKK